MAVADDPRRLINAPFRIGPRLLSLVFYIDAFASLPADSLRQSTKISRMANGPCHKWLGIPPEALSHQETQNEGAVANASKVFSKTTMITNSISQPVIG